MAAVPLAHNQTKAGARSQRTALGKPNAVNKTARVEPSRSAGMEQVGAGMSMDEFNTLILEYQDAAYSFACYLTGDPDLADDVTQKAFINAYTNIHQYRGVSFHAWLFRIIRNVAYDEFRRPGYRKDTSLEAMEETYGWKSLPADSQDPQSAVEAHERSRQVQRAIQRVEEPYRSILVMVDLHEMDYQEAAHAAGVPVGTVKSRLARARQHFRAAMGTAL